MGKRLSKLPFSELPSVFSLMVWCHAVHRRMGKKEPMCGHCFLQHGSRKTRAHKLKKNSGDTGRASLGHLVMGQTGVYRLVSRGFPVVCYRPIDRQGHFCRDAGRVSQGQPTILRAKNKKKLNFLWPKMARLGPPF